MSGSPFVILNFGQVQVQIQVRPITSSGLQVHLAQETARIKQLLAGRTRLAPRKAVVIVDGSVAFMPPPDARKLQAEWLKQNADLLRLVTHELGFVLPNPIVRGFVAAVFFLVQLPVPSVTHASLEDAVEWALRESAGIGGEVDPALLANRTAAIEEARQKALAHARSFA